MFIVEHWKSKSEKFVTINLLGGFSWFFLDIKVKAFIRVNLKYAN